MVLISHDLALVASVADRVMVMYAGQAMECATPTRLFDAPAHPYTQALMRALPEANRGRGRLQALAGSVPGRLQRPSGCLLAPRCAHVRVQCNAQRPALRVVAPGVQVACHLAGEWPISQ